MRSRSSSHASPARGRPRGSKSFDLNVAQAFGSLVREGRIAQGISQEDMAHMALMERSYFGRIERGQSQPTLFVLLKIAKALSVDAGTLVAAVENILDKSELPTPPARRS
jgi:transcriptional regulator with XRE-family HTH domain